MSATREDLVASIAAGNFSIINGWLVEFVNRHTCGTDEGGHYGAHEPGCGYEPVGPIIDLIWPEAVVTP